MSENQKTKKIYIIVTQTGTILSRILKRTTGAKYNHVSISLDSSLRTMYSFGRKYTYIPFLGGFVTESPFYGTFKRFSETEAVVIAVEVEEKIYYEMEKFLHTMYTYRMSYHYNYLGLLLAAFRICYKKPKHYYCSEFVKDMLVRFDIVEKGRFQDITQPIHFLNLAIGGVVYRGKLRCYDKWYKKLSKQIVKN